MPKAELLIVMLCSLAPMHVWAAVEGCPDCASSLALSHKQVECLARRIDRLIGRLTEPVFFDASSCGQAIGSMTAADPSIPTPSPAPRPEAIWVQLTKKQLTCLKAKMNAIPPGVAEPIAIALDDAGCAPPKP